MSRPEIHGWIIDRADQDPLQDPLYTGTSSGGYNNVPFFLHHEDAVAQLEWWNRMFPGGPELVITEATLTTEHET